MFVVELFYFLVSRVFNELENIWSDFVVCCGVLEGIVCIGVLLLSWIWLLFFVIVVFLVQYLGIIFMINESLYELLVVDMWVGNIDFIIGVLCQDEDFLDFCSEVLFEEDMLILLCNNYLLLCYLDLCSQLVIV